MSTNPDLQAEVILDLSGVGSERELHELFSRELRFPSYYGHNWDAFYDILVGERCLPRKLILRGSEHFRHRVPRAYEQLQRCFNDARGELPDQTPFVVWQ